MSRKKVASILSESFADYRRSSMWRCIPIEPLLATRLPHSERQCQETKSEQRDRRRLRNRCCDDIDRVVDSAARATVTTIAADRALEISDEGRIGEREVPEL